MVKVNKNSTTNAIEKKTPHPLLIGLQTGAVTTENSLDNYQKVRRVHTMTQP